MWPECRQGHFSRQRLWRGPKAACASQTPEAARGMARLFGRGFRLFRRHFLERFDWMEWHQQKLWKHIKRLRFRMIDSSSDLDLEKFRDRPKNFADHQADSRKISQELGFDARVELSVEV